MLGLLAHREFTDFQCCQRIIIAGFLPSLSERREQPISKFERGELHSFRHQHSQHDCRPRVCREAEPVNRPNGGYDRIVLSRQLQHLSCALFNLHKARVRCASGFLLTAFSNARPVLMFCSTQLTKGAPPKKH